MIKLFASDLDGTLFNAMHRTDAVIRRALREVTAAGAHFAIATGRNVFFPGSVGLEGIDLDIVCCNGAIVRDSSGSLVQSFPIDKDVLYDMLCTLPDICFECVTSDKTYVRGSREQREEGFKRDSPLRRIVFRGMRGKRVQRQGWMVFDQTPEQILEHDVCKVNCRVADDALREELGLYIDRHADSIVDAPFNPVMFEITRHDVNKGESIAWLARHYGIEENEVAVYGDGGNDLVMLGRFEHAYATANGSRDAKRAAGNVIGNCALHAVPRHMVSTVRGERSRVTIA